MLRGKISDTADNKYWRLFVRAAKAGDARVARVVTVFLAHAGIDIDARNDDGCTPLVVDGMAWRGRRQDIPVSLAPR